VSQSFEIEIIAQGWLEPGEGYDPERQDLCTHGRVHLVIGGEMIADSAEGSTGLARLRWLFYELWRAITHKTLALQSA
jgi:hypothetical protein